MSFDYDAIFRHDIVVYFMLAMLIVIMVGTFMIAYGGTKSYRDLILGYNSAPALHWIQASV